MSLPPSPDLGPPTAPADPRVGLAATVAAVLALSCGSSVVALAHSPGPTVAFWRLALATVIWHAVLAVRGVRLTAAEWRRALVPGVAFGVNITLFFTAVTRTSVAHAEFIGALAPLVIVPVGARLFGEHVPRRALVFGLTAIVGLAVVLFNGAAGTTTSWSGDLLAGVAVVAWTVYILATRANRKDMDVARFMAAATPVALVTMSPVAIARGGLVDLPARGWIVVVVLAVVTGVVSHGLVVFAQHHLPVSTISVLQVAQPALAVGWAAILLDQAVTGLQIVGGAIVVASLVLFVVTVGAMRRRTASAAALAVP